MSTMNKTDRFEVRVNAEEKETVERAAMLSGLTVSAYMRSCIIQRANQDIHKLETIALSNRDRDRFLSALENSNPTSTGNLKQAFSRFRKKYELS
jgi:uncharacterized protein (DUF1778 family)